VAMSLTYVRNRAKAFRNAQDETERQDLLQKLAIHLKLAEAGEQLTQEQQQKLYLELRRLGISIYHRPQEQPPAVHPVVN
jgi:hypothetical protein